LISLCCVIENLLFFAKFFGISLYSLFSHSVVARGLKTCLCI